LPLGRPKPTVYFVGSMADRFHEDVPDAFIDRVRVVACPTSRHTDLLLTPRVERLPRFFSSRPVPAHVGLGVTGEDRDHLPCIEPLHPVPARIRFLSVEPLLEDWGPINLDGIHGVIGGGEFGPEARPMREAWAIRDPCE
jgi:protein gp37